MCAYTGDGNNVMVHCTCLKYIFRMNEDDMLQHIAQATRKCV